jgi:hypothetical protein
MHEEKLFGGKISKSVLIRKELGIIGFLLLVLFFWKVELKLSAAVDDRNNNATFAFCIGNHAINPRYGAAGKSPIKLRPSH